MHIYYSLGGLYECEKLNILLKDITIRFGLNSLVLITQTRVLLLKHIYIICILDELVVAYINIMTLL